MESTSFEAKSPDDKERTEDTKQNDNDTKQNIKEAKQDTVHYDDLLSAAGELGLYQIQLFISTCPFYAFGIFVYFGQMFMTEVSPNHWCKIPALENLTDLDRRNLAIPKDDSSEFGYSQCKMYDVNWTEEFINRQQPTSNWSTIPCQYGWEFNKTEIPYPTIISELGWLCDKGSYQANAQAIAFVGSIAGGIIIGWMADRYGRLPALVVSNMIGCIAGIASSFSRNFSEFAASRFFVGMASDNCMTLAYLLVLEYTAPNYRTIMASLAFAIFYCVFAVILPWIALACGHWKILSLVTSVPLGLALLSPFFIPESPRWLLSQGRIDTAINKILVISRINKKEIPQKQIEQFKSSLHQTKSEKSQSFMEILKRPKLRRVFMMMCLEYMCCAAVFDALARSLGLLKFDYFLSFTLVSLTEFPSMLLTALVMDWTGRRWMIIFVMSLISICCILTAFANASMTIVLVVIASFGANVSYAAPMQWIAEMLPTTVRGSGVSVVHICGYVGTIFSPYIIYLKIYNSWIPLVVTGCVAAIGVLTAFGIPETAGTDMPHTFEDAENLVMNNRIWAMPCIGRNKCKKRANNKCDVMN